MDDSLFSIFPCGSGWRFPSAIDVHLGTCLTAQHLLCVMLRTEFARRWQRGVSLIA